MYLALLIKKMKETIFTMNCGCCFYDFISGTDIKVNSAVDETYLIRPCLAMWKAACGIWP